RERIDRVTIAEQSQHGLIDQRDTTLCSALQLHEPRCRGHGSRHNQSVTVNFPNAASSTLKPSPGVFSSRSMKPSFGMGSPLKMYQNNSFPTSTSTGGKNSAIGELRLAITM